MQTTNFSTESYKIMRPTFYL